LRSIEIIGGGLSGLALGIGLRKRGIPVQVREAGSYPRHKVCGEFICGVSQKTLQTLGIYELFESAPFYRKSRWFRGNDVLLDQELKTGAWGISRYRMDEWLQEYFQSLGGHLITRERVKPEAREGLVWSAGRIPQSDSKWLGLKVHMRGYQMYSELEMHMGRQGYAGLVQVEDDWINLCGLFEKRRQVEGKYIALLESYLRLCGLTHLADVMAESEVRDGSFCAVAGFDLGVQNVDDGRLVIGDAESMIPPFTGNGMSMAFESAETALSYLCEYAQGRLTWEKCRINVARALKKRFRTRLVTAGSCHPFLLSSAGQSALSIASRTKLLPFNTLFTLTH